MHKDAEVEIKAFPSSQGWLRQAKRRRRRGGQIGKSVSAELLLRLRPIGLALRDHPGSSACGCRATPPSARRGIFPYGSSAVMLRFGTCPTGMRVTSFIAWRSITDTEF